MSDGEIIELCQQIDKLIDFLTDRENGILGDLNDKRFIQECPYYLHVLNTHVPIYLGTYRTLAPFSMQGHERINKKLKNLWNNHTNKMGINYNNIYENIRW